MNLERIKEIQKETAYPESLSVQQALLKLWNECEQGKLVKNNVVLPHVRKSLAPYVCPVCGGNGLVPNGFYRQTSGQWSTSDVTPEECRSCGGTGVLWG